MATIKAKDGTDLYYTDWNTGSPIVLIHGWPLHADMWEYQAAPLAEAGHRVIAYDRRGFGRSGRPWGGYDYDTLAGDLNDVLTQLDVRDATLVGFSMGGGEVVRYLARHGADRVARAVLVSAVTPFMLKTGDNPEGVDQSVFDGMLKGIVNDRPGFLATFGKQFFGAGILNFSVSSDIMEWAREMALTGSAHATVQCARAFATTDFRADLARVTVPIDTSARRTVKMISGATLVEYAGGPHAITYTERERLTRDILAFAAGYARPVARQ